MRKLRIFAHISLDGIIEHDAPYKYGAWTAPYRGPVGMQLVLDAQGPQFDLLLGRKTYDLWSTYWPKAPSSPMADRINAATKYVATHRPESLAWGPVKDLGKDILAGVRNAKAVNGPDLILWGSTTLTSLLLAEGLVDEVVLITYPVLLGEGKRLFVDRDARELTFVSSASTPTGLLMNTYRYVGALPKT